MTGKPRQPGQGLRVLVLGGTSAIAEATARLYAAEGARLVLAGRNAARLDAVARDLALRGAGTVAIELGDLSQGAGPARLEAMCRHFGGFDHVLIAYGELGDEGRAARDPQGAARLLQVNLISAVQWADAAAAMLETQGSGSLVAIGSVAGDRGKRSNYIYGASKAGLAVVLEGIAHRFAGKGPRAAVVKPGPTDTPMTAGMRKGGPLWSTPEAVARVVRRAADRGGEYYAPARWRWIMAALRLLPRFAWNRLDI